MGDVVYLIGTGFALGVVHVLTGPDHLSAIATLSANVGNNVEAAYLGIRWGIGHSSGLLLVGSIMILLSHAGQDTVEMPDYASHVFESIVGIFMILLGTYGVRRALLKHPNNTQYNAIENDSSPTEEERNADGSQQLTRLENDGIFKINSDEDGHEEFQVGNLRGPVSLQFDGDECPVCVPPPVFGQDQDGHTILVTSGDESDLEGAVVVETAYLDTVSPSRCRRYCNSITRRTSTKTVAFMAGIVHGLAGPGGVLGVIPAVQLHNGKLAAVYLSCFCVSSIITMGCFATMYGYCSSTIVKNGTGQGREFLIECVSATLSIVVGITWLTLLALGKLEDVFP
jgi:uncharacterized membrane protein YfcA